MLRHFYPRIPVSSRAFYFTDLPALLRPADHLDFAGFRRHASRGSNIDSPPCVADGTLDHRIHGDHLCGALHLGLVHLVGLPRKFPFLFAPFYASSNSRCRNGWSMGRRYVVSQGAQRDGG